jgi:hypothetical protein
MGGREMILSHDKNCLCNTCLPEIKPGPTYMEAVSDTLQINRGEYKKLLEQNRIKKEALAWYQTLNAPILRWTDGDGEGCKGTIADIAIEAIKKINELE